MAILCLRDGLQKIMITRKTKREIEKMRKAGKILARTFEHLNGFLQEGISTQELDREIERVICKLGGIPAFKDYRGFPANSCISINEEVVHGIPDGRVLRRGDIVSIDVGVCYNKYFADSAYTFPISPISVEARGLIYTCRSALFEAIEKIRSGILLRDISRTIEEASMREGYSVVKKYVGHGIGRNLHEEPQVPNFVKEDLADNEVVLQEGMTLAIEPMMNMGSSDVMVLNNGWTVATVDRKLSAHFEHTIAVTEEGSEILTLSHQEDTWF